jgi:hypothetical protein
MQKIGKDITKASTTLGRREARYLVDTYYMMQRPRIRSGNQAKAMGDVGEPNDVTKWLSGQFGSLEESVASALEAYTDSDPLGVWAKSIDGIGPIISAGLLAYIDVEIAATAGCVWRFCGLDPTQKWWNEKEADAIIAEVMGDAKGVKPEHIIECARIADRHPETLEKVREFVLKKSKWTKSILQSALKMRPWSGALKTLCWKIGESFVRVKGTKPDSYYSKIYEERHVLEDELNAKGEYREQALDIAKKKPNHAQHETYASGILPLGHIHMRSKRYATKLFLAHYWETGRKLKGLPVPAPYPIAFLGHAHKIEPPNQS